MPSQVRTIAVTMLLLCANRAALDGSPVAPTQVPALPAAPAAAQAPGVSSASDALADLDWLAGRWVGTMANGRHIEEMWMPARDGLMIGSFRWERGNGRWLFEFMSLDTAGAESSGGLLLRLKHYDRAFRGMEEKDASTTFALVARASSRAVFELREATRLVRLTYTRTAPDALSVLFEEQESGKAPTRIQFPYERAR